MDDGRMHVILRRQVKSQRKQVLRRPSRKSLIRWKQFKAFPITAKDRQTPVHQEDFEFSQ